MDVQCERCKTEYEFDDALVSGRGTTVRCTNCGHQFKVRRLDHRGEGEEDLWIVTRSDGRQVSFATLRELQRAILAKHVSRNDTLQRRGSAPRQLGAIAELEPFFQGRTSSRPPPADPAAEYASTSFPKRSAAWQGDGASSNASLTPPVPVVVPARRTASYGSAADPPRRKMDTLRPPANGTAAPPPASPLQIQPQPIVHADPRAAPVLTGRDEAEPITRRQRTPSMPPVAPVMPPIRPPSAPDFSSPLLPPTRPRQRSVPVPSEAGSSMRPSMPPSEMYGVPRGRRVGGWVVAFALLMAVGVVGWVVAKPYLVTRDAGAAAQLDPRAQSFVTDGEHALADGNLELAKEDFDKASALAESDPRVLLDQARLACALADVPWLKARLLPADAAEEQRTTQALLSERVARAKSAADQALAVAPADLAAMRAKIDALRLAGERDAARSYVSKVISQASQPETAYVLAALDLAEPEPLWTTVVDRLRFAAAGEGNAARARAALAYALARSGDVAGAKGELAKLDALPRPYADLVALHAFVDRAAHAVAGGPVAKPGADAGAPGPARAGLAAAAPAAVGAAPQAGGPPGSPAGNGAAGGAPGGDGLTAAAQAIKKGDWDRARQIYDALVTRNPNDSEALCGIGDVARAQGDNGGAIAAYKHVISVNPSYLPALLGLADTQWVSGDRAAAAKGYRDIVDRFPEGTYPSYVKHRTDVPAPATQSAASSSPARAQPGDPSTAGE